MYTALREVCISEVSEQVTAQMQEDEIHIRQVYHFSILT